jgi:RNase adaptor protein for sRNA GlmZ degradation
MTGIRGSRTPEEISLAGLLVSVCSFGYHRSGIPPNPHGDGGGFVFDCRLFKNPGREARFRSRNGRDPEVVAFLENDPEVDAFLDRAQALLDPVLRSYASRGHAHLQVCFGCTGGQHRSVYCAERMAERLRALGVRVELEHREQGVWW